MATSSPEPVARTPVALALLACGALLCGWLVSPQAALAGGEGPGTPGVPLLDLGSIFDPDSTTDAATQVNDPFDALLNGRVHANVRLRYEVVDDDVPAPAAVGGRRGWADAWTVRSRIGFSTAEWSGFSAYAELENVLSADPHRYDPSPAAPLGLANNPTQAVIADPWGTELNQLFGKYRFEDQLEVIAGRQRITLDDHRFVGNVGWRQDEQTFDGAQVRYIGVEDLVVTYAYIYQVNRIFHDKADFNADGHLVNAAYKTDFGKFVGFAYLLDFNSDSPVSEGRTVGLRYTHAVPIFEADKVNIAASIAHQADAGAMHAFDAAYYALDLAYAHQATGITVGGGLEVLGSDNGLYGFQTPLATGHKFNGWADRFLATPTNGLRDAYAYVGGTLPFQVKGKIVYHRFFGDEAEVDYGGELDFVLTRKLTDNVSVLTKFAYYDGDGTVSATSPDTGLSANDAIKYWLQLEVKF